MLPQKLLVLTLATGLAVANGEWWRSAQLYQVYLRSFSDSDGDGNGDLRGLINRVPYLKKIGVGVVWVSPINDSPWEDNGYDVSDYRNVHPVFGSLNDVRELITLIHEHGMKFLMDFVPNHTSDKHPWFKASKEGTGDFKDYYVWKDPKGWNGQTPQPPNNWVSEFGGSAWEYVEGRKQFYLHQFGPYQPDLNYENPKVVEAMKAEMKFWLDMGVDGFRVDAIPFISEDPLLRDEPRIPGCNEELKAYCFDHIYTRNQPGTYRVMEAFDTMLRKDYHNQKFFFGEAYASLEQTMEYYNDVTAPFNFLLLSDLHLDSNATQLEAAITNYLKHIPEGKYPNWVAGNHDNSRVGSRFGSEFIDPVNMMAILLPGSGITYQGEEIGMVDMVMRSDEKKDFRDPVRTPMQWDRTRNSGFSYARKTWLPVNPNFWRLNVQSQLADGTSHLSIYRNLTSIKEDIGDHLDLTTTVYGDWIFAFKRKGRKYNYIVVVNLNDLEEEVVATNIFPEIRSSVSVAVASPNTGFKVGDRFSSYSVIPLFPRSGVVFQY